MASLFRKSDLSQHVFGEDSWQLSFLRNSGKVVDARQPGKEFGLH